MGYAKAIIVGNVGRDPDLRYTQDGRAVTSLRIAASRSYRRNDGTKVEETTWLTCVGWGQTAESLAKYVTKGRKLLVEGRIQERPWTDQQGNQRRSFEIVISEWQLLDSRPQNAGAAPAAAGAEEAADEDLSGEDIPF